MLSCGNDACRGRAGQLARAGAASGDIVATYLVAVDFSECSLRAFAWAVARAEAVGASLCAVHVLAPPAPLPSVDVAISPAFGPGSSERLNIHAAEQALEDLIKGCRVPCTEEVRVGDVASEIVSAVSEQRPDLLVMGSHGRTGIKRFVLGSVSESVLRRATCPVMVVPKGASDSGELAAVRQAND